MRTSTKTFLICVVIIGAFCFGRSTHSNFEFPELTKAKQNAMQAKTNLQNAKKEFGGHRVKAIDHLDKAIKEIDEAVLYGDKN